MKKKCQFCQKKNTYIDYKNLPVLVQFTSYYTKIVPKYYTGTCLNHQKKLSRAIKRARFMGLIPVTR
ncbi:30S ribosomal protein S18 [Candidatus Peregrinibacteria bacterium]|nr:30S ribosomal protein S18 [Candidatus Peregrinibacteria bacterium]